MSYDTLALTMQMQCPLEGFGHGDGLPTRHRVNADGITGSAWWNGDIRAVCGTEVMIPLGDDCPREAPPSHQWGQPWDPDDCTDRGHNEPGRWPCPACEAWEPNP